MRKCSSFGLRLIVGLAAVVPTALMADENAPGLPFELGPVNLRATLDAAAGAFSVKNAQFGQGSNSRTGERAGGRTWYEGFVTPGLQFEIPIDALGGVYGRISAAASATRGVGDAQATSTTSDQPGHFGVEDAYIGWTSGTSFDLPDDMINLSIGNQPFTVGDGFLIANGTSDGGGRAAYFLGPRVAFERTAIARLNMDPVRADLFHLQANTDQVLMYGNDTPDTRLVGANVEWFGSVEDAARFDYDKRVWYLGVTALKIYEADRAFSFSGARGGGDVAANRDGLNVFSARFGGSFVPELDDLKIYGEWAIQRNNRSNGNGNGGSVRADAWHLQPEYSFGALPWAPTVTARYAHFSGDPNTGDSVDESWDPLFSDAGPRGITTWTQGYIYSQYVGSNSNLNSYHVGLRANPVDTVDLGIAYYRHNYAKPSQAGATSAHVMDELDIYATWTTPIAGLTVSPAIGAGWSGKGQRQALGIAAGDERTIWLGQVVLAYQF